MEYLLIPFLFIYSHPIPRHEILRVLPSIFFSKLRHILCSYDLFLFRQMIDKSLLFSDIVRIDTHTMALTPPSFSRSVTVDPE